MYMNKKPLTQLLYILYYEIIINLKLFFAIMFDVFGLIHNVEPLLSIMRTRAIGKLMKRNIYLIDSRYEL